MIPIPIPPQVRAARPDCEPHRMGPPAGVEDQDCGTVEMLVSELGMSGTLPGRRAYAYFRPTPAELALLNAGGFIEYSQHTTGGVIPFGAVVWAPADARCRECGCTESDCSGCIARTGEPCEWVEADLCSACVQQPADPGHYFSPWSRREDWLRDQHARFHDQRGNLLHRDECGWERCGFWDAAAHTLSAALPSTTIQTEHALRMSGGGYDVRNPGEHVERIYPLQQWIADQQGHGCTVYRRRVIVVDEWEPLPEVAGDASGTRDGT